MDLYKNKLQTLGYQEALRDDEVGDEPLMRNSEKKVLEIRDRCRAAHVPFFFQ